MVNMLTNHSTRVWIKKLDHPPDQQVDTTQNLHLKAHLLPFPCFLFLFPLKLRNILLNQSSIFKKIENVKNTIFIVSRNAFSLASLPSSLYYNCSV